MAQNRYTIIDKKGNLLSLTEQQLNRLQNEPEQSEPTAEETRYAENCCHFVAILVLKSGNECTKNEQIERAKNKTREAANR